MYWFGLKRYMFFYRSVALRKKRAEQEGKKLVTSRMEPYEARHGAPCSNRRFLSLGPAPHNAATAALRKNRRKKGRPCGARHQAAYRHIARKAIQKHSCFK
jgi:hypothetical protein